MQITFTRKSEALRIIKRLYDHTILARRVVSERGNYVVDVHVPPKYSFGAIEALVQKLRTEKR